MGPAFTAIEAKISDRSGIGGDSYVRTAAEVAGGATAIKNTFYRQISNYDISNNGDEDMFVCICMQQPQFSIHKNRILINLPGFKTNN